MRLSVNKCLTDIEFILRLNIARWFYLQAWFV